MRKHKKRSKTRVVGVVAGMLIILLFTANAMALKPKLNKWGFVVLKVEHPHDGLRSYFHAVAGGAEMWFVRYYRHIINYLSTSGSYYAWLPRYGYTRVTAWKLARMLFYDRDISRRRIQSQLYYTLINALKADRRYGPARSVGMVWDPTTIWKWRAGYMEWRIGASNQRGNCFGNADYMTKGDQWILAYPILSDFHNFYFPSLVLKGTKDEDPANCPYYLDRDLKGSDFGFAVKGDYLYVGYYINCFDIIRIATTAGNSPLIITTNNGTVLNLGTPYHAAAFLCSDRAANTWVFEKPCFCKPVKICIMRKFSNQFKIDSYFYHKGYAKEVITGIWDPNWAGVPTSRWGR